MVRKKETFTDDEDVEGGGVDESIGFDDSTVQEEDQKPKGSLAKRSRIVEPDPGIESRKRAHQEKIRR